MNSIYTQMNYIISSKSDHVPPFNTDLTRCFSGERCPSGVPQVFMLTTAFPACGDSLTLWCSSQWASNGLPKRKILYASIYTQMNHVISFKSDIVFLINTTLLGCSSGERPWGQVLPVFNRCFRWQLPFPPVVIVFIVMQQSAGLKWPTQKKKRLYAPLIMIRDLMFLLWERKTDNKNIMWHSIERGQRRKLPSVVRWKGIVSRLLVPCLFLSWNEHALQLQLGELLSLACLKWACPMLLSSLLLFSTIRANINCDVCPPFPSS